MASGNLIGCKVHGPALAYSSMDVWVCIMFSKKLSIYIPSMYVSRKTPGNLEGTHGLWGTIVCTTKYMYMVHSYTQKPQIPWKIAKTMKIMCKLPFFYGDLEGLGYICVSAWKKYTLGIPWRHSNCWLPNSFILGGGRHSKIWNAGKMQFSSFAAKKNI